MTAERTDLPGAPESRLPIALLEQVLAAQPDRTPPPPWPTRVEAVLWWHRSAPAARDALPAGLRQQHTMSVTVGAYLRYLDTPVGPYEEVLAVPAVLPGRLLPRVHVPFIAVDSPASVRGGREHWALPKTLAEFATDADGVTVRGADWQVRVAARPRGPRLPAVAAFELTQAGTSRSRVRGTARYARVDVRVDSALRAQHGSIAAWLLPGSHHGVVLAARLRVGPVRPGR